MKKIIFILLVIILFYSCFKNKEKDINFQQIKDNIQKPVNHDITGEYYSETGKEMLKINYLDKEKKYEFMIYIQIMVNYEGDKESELYMTMYSKNTDLIEDQTGDKTWVLIEQKLSKTSYGYQFYEKEIRLINQTPIIDNSNDQSESLSSSTISSANFNVDNKSIKEKTIDFYKD